MGVLKMHRYSSKNLTNARRNRRERNATHQEAVLWHVFLKKSKTNFARQYRVGNYILDFYAPSINLAIELDGGQHYDDSTIAYDKARTDYLNSLGINVIRFTNSDIDTNLNGVIRVIKSKTGEE